MAFWPATNRMETIMTPAEIRTLRKRLKLSTDQFAAALGFTGKNRAANIWRWETKKRNPSPQSIKLMKAMRSD